MPAPLNLQEVSFRYPTQADPLFRDVTFTLHSGDKVALLGYNGVGKTTLLELILGRRTPEAGAVSAAPAFYLHQDEQLALGTAVEDSLLATWPELQRLRHSLQAMEHAKLPDPLAYADTMATFTERGGFALEARLEQLVAAFGFAPEVLKRPVTALSGGERRLLKLASAFLSEQALVIFDEPTNYLDEVGTRYLVEAIQNSNRGFLIVSHDRWFLDRTVTRVLELEWGGLQSYQGNYSSFLATKEARFKDRQRQAQKLAGEIHKLQEAERTYKIWGARKEKEKSGAADKGYIGARAARLMKRGIQAKARIHARIEDLQAAKPWIEKQRTVRFEEVRAPSGTCLAVSGLRHKLADRLLLDDLSFTVDWGEKVALVGPNGSGKTTLLKLLLGEVQPQEGGILWAKHLEVGYVPQLWDPSCDHQPAATLFAEDMRAQARILLGCLRVKGDAFEKPLAALSEGQKRKVRLVQLILVRPNVLILDEPTTHLDVGSVEMLEAALLEFKGTVVLVSHDRYLRERVAGREVRIG